MLFPLYTIALWAQLNADNHPAVGIIILILQMKKLDQEVNLTRSQLAGGEAGRNLNSDLFHSNYMLMKVK